MKTDEEAPPPIKYVGVVGGGLMGSGIAEVFAAKGLDVILTERSTELVEQARARVTASVERAVKKGRVTPHNGQQTLARIQFADSLQAHANRQLVIEAATENEALKLEIFADLDSVVKDSAGILASNTSSIPISKLGAATKRPWNVIGLHFFNPAPVQPLVEVIHSLRTTQSTVDRVDDMLRNVVGKETILAKDQAGFVVNALLIPYLLSAIRMLEAGYATAEEIDKGMTMGCAHPMGPLRLADFVGLDTLVSAAESIHHDSRQPHHAPPALLSRMVEAGMTGRKSGAGFYMYD